MFATIVLLTAGVPAFSPAPVSRRPIVAGSLFEASIAKRTITLECGGGERVFKVARDAKFTFNGEGGYTIQDLTEIDDFHESTASLTHEKGIADSVDVTFKLSRGQKLWKPGMGPRQIIKNEINEQLRAARARLIQGR